MTVPEISQLPDHPTRADAPPDFTQKADTWVGAMRPMTEQINKCVLFVSGRAVDADASAHAAYISELAAKASEQAAEASRLVAINRADAASQSALAASQSAGYAAGSAAAAAESEGNAAGSEESALISEQRSKQSELLALAAKDAAEAAAGGKFLPDSVAYAHEDGRVIKITENNVFDTIINYNHDGTVHSIERPGGRIETFAYDSLGNVTNMTAIGGDTP